MNKVYIEGWVYDLQATKLPHNVDDTTFKIKTKKIVGRKESDKPAYDYIPCHVRGKKATNMINNVSDGTRVYIWGRMHFDEQGNMTIAVDEVEFL